jgi:hypothetical protein
MVRFLEFDILESGEVVVIVEDITVMVVAFEYGFGSVWE